jgi:hypothetical protein
VFIFIESRNQGVTDKKRSLDYIRQKSIVTGSRQSYSSQDMLRPSSIDKDEEWQKEESS